jgi:hypothetical protein
MSVFGRDPVEVTEHVWLLERSGLVQATFAGDSPSNGAAVIFRLTPAGHEFTAQARQPALWNKAKDAAVKAGVGASAEILKKALTHFAGEAIHALLSKM